LARANAGTSGCPNSANRYRQKRFPHASLPRPRPRPILLPRPVDPPPPRRRAPDLWHTGQRFLLGTNARVSRLPRPTRFSAPARLRHRFRRRPVPRRRSFYPRLSHTRSLRRDGLKLPRRDLRRPCRPRPSLPRHVPRSLHARRFAQSLLQRPRRPRSRSSPRQVARCVSPRKALLRHHHPMRR